MARLDEQLFLWINGFVGRWPVFDGAMKVIVSDYFVPVVMFLCLLGLWFAVRDPASRLAHQKAVITVIATVLIANFAIEVMNDFYFRPRPFVDNPVSLLFYKPTDSSFPANSAASAFAIAGTIWAVNKKIGAALAVLAFMFAFARVYAGVHYPLDVTGGALIGMAAAMLTTWVKEFTDPFLTKLIKVARALCLA